METGCPHLAEVVEQVLDRGVFPKTHLMACKYCRTKVVIHLCGRYALSTTTRFSEKGCLPQKIFRLVFRDFFMTQQGTIDYYAPAQETIEEFVIFRNHYDRCSLCRLYFEELLCTARYVFSAYEELILEGGAPKFFGGHSAESRASDHIKTFLLGLAEALEKDPAFVASASITYY